jgi:hypothetical protein
MSLEFSGRTFDKHLNFKFHENTSIGTQVVPCGWTDKHTDMVKLIVTFRNSADVPKNGTNHNECRAC